MMKMAKIVMLQDWENIHWTCPFNLHLADTVYANKLYNYSYYFFNVYSLSRLKVVMETLIENK